MATAHSHVHVTQFTFVFATFFKSKTKATRILISNFVDEINTDAVGCV